jgi:hypothetical protein
MGVSKVKVVFIEMLTMRLSTMLILKPHDNTCSNARLILVKLNFIDDV